MAELLAVAIMAAAWWIPTFVSLSDLQRRQDIPRLLWWKWAAILCVPVAGAVLYRTRGMREVEAARTRS